MTEDAGIPPGCEIEIRLASGAEARASGVVQVRTNGRVRTGSRRGGGHPGRPSPRACYRAKNAGPRVRPGTVEQSGTAVRDGHEIMQFSEPRDFTKRTHSDNALSHGRPFS